MTHLAFCDPYSKYYFIVIVINFVFVSVTHRASAQHHLTGCGFEQASSRRSSSSRKTTGSLPMTGFTSQSGR
jgi:hypothetical protein